MDGTPVAAGVGMLAGKEERLRHRLRELLGGVDGPSGNVSVSAQAVGIGLPIVHMPAEQVFPHLVQGAAQHECEAFEACLW